MNNEPRYWQPGTTLSYPELRASQLFPRSRSQRLIPLLFVPLVLLILLVPQSARSVAAAFGAVIGIGTLYYVMAVDYRRIYSVITKHAPIPANHKVNVRPPASRMLIPYLITFWFAFYLSDTVGAVVTGLLILTAHLQGQIAPILIRHILLPTDSIEASNQRDAAAISFVLSTGACVAVTLALGAVATQTLDVGEFNDIAAYIPFAVGGLAAGFAWSVYGITYFSLKRKRS